MPQAVVTLLLAALLQFSSQAPVVTAGVFRQCGLAGTAKPVKVRALNRLKNRSSEPPIINRAITARALLAPGNDTKRWSSSDGAEIEAYLVDAIHGGKETANCGASDPQWIDTHIELGLTPDAPPNQRIIVEVTPRFRAAMQTLGVDWSTAALRALAGQKVRVRGWMLFDAEHVNAAEATHPGGVANWRATCWEIHPVVSLAVVP